MAEVVLQNVAKSYDKTLVIQDVSLTVRDQEFVVMVGPSGCGKSTILRMIAGLESITGGTIQIEDRVVNDVAPKDRDIAMVFQNYALYPHMSVYENMAFGLKMRKTPKAEIDEKVKEAARILDLEHLLQRKPKQLSGGQRQRVALGRAIVRNPKVFLMDEPLSNLDAKLRVQMRTEIAALHKRLNATTIYVTHDQVEAMTMGHRIVILNKGKIQQVDTPLNVYHQPANMFVAGFVGQMNFLTGVLDAEGLRLGDTTVLPVPEALVDRIAGMSGQAAVMGLRPEHVVPESSPEWGPVYEVIPDRVEMLGSEQMVHFSLSGHTLVARWASDLPVQEGQPLKVKIDIAKALLFDGATEARIV
ncbi:ABC transporter ATP-binding protein [Vampirovibrio sp.]|uniref:ABC transporter ATP-binding protein n=1 Tax=Vampirovibrio sp. TaxID=2717857 RepID=UPI0035945EAA